VPLRAAATTDAAIGSTWTDIGDSADRELLPLSLCGLCGAQHGETCHPVLARFADRAEWTGGLAGLVGYGEKKKEKKGERGGEKEREIREKDAMQGSNSDRIHFSKDVSLSRVLVNLVWARQSDQS